MQQTLFLFLVVLGFESQGQSLQSIATPNLKGDSEIIFRVAYVENKRFPTISAATLSSILAASTKIAKDKFDLNVRVASVDILGFVDIDLIMSAMPRKIIDNELSDSYTLSRPKIHPDKLPELINRTELCLRESEIPLQQMIDFAKFPSSINSTYRGLAEYLLSLATQRYENIANAKALDDKPVIDGIPYNEWKMWQALGYAQLPYEIVITNQPILSLEWSQCSPHAMLRGGLSIGGTTYSRHSNLGTYAVFSLFPFISSNPGLTALNRGPVFDPTELAEHAGAYLVHEYGHVLLHLGHPFSRDDCVMNPAADLNIRQWWQSREEGSCPVGSEPQMNPGAARLRRLEYEF